MRFFLNRDVAPAPFLPEQFISETIEPCGCVFDAEAMAAGSPGVPSAFVWRGKEIRVKAVLSSSKTTRPCRNGSGERYVGKHIYRAETEDGWIMNLYRRRSGSKRDTWTLYTIQNKAEENE